MAKRFFYVKGDDKKTPVELSAQAKGTDLVCVMPTGKEIDFKAGSMFVNLATSKEDAIALPEAAPYVVEKATQVKPSAAKALKATTAPAASTGLAALSHDQKALKIAEAMSKAADLKVAHPSVNVLTEKPAAPAPVAAPAPAKAKKSESTPVSGSAA